MSGVDSTIKRMRSCLVGVASLLSLTTVAALAAGNFPVPLNSNNPDRPLTIFQDRTFSGKQLQQPLAIDEFLVDADKGAPTLVIDFAAARDSDERGDSSISINLECNPVCKIPLNKSVMSIRTEFMGEDAFSVDRGPEHLWLTRGVYPYSFAPGTHVWGYLVPGDSTHLQTRAVRMRWVYGTPEDLVFPGQKTRSGLILKIAGSLLFMLLLGGWWLRRQ